jgi:DNA-binding PadR family transcriptional regulator
MILRYFFPHTHFQDETLENRGPFSFFGHGHGHGHGRRHGQRHESEERSFTGFGPFGAGGRGRRGGFGSGRKIGSGDLQLVLLALLAEKPSYGYELIKALEERSGGYYIPSPGMIYPALTYLEELGHATVEIVGTRKLYRITDDGASYLAEHRANVDAIMAGFAKIGERMDDVRRAMDGDEAPTGIHTARHALRNALHSKRGCSAHVAKEIAKILERAATEISAL